MVQLNRRRGLLLEARRFVRAARERIRMVHDAEESFDIALDETLSMANRMEIWLDELIEAEEKEATNGQQDEEEHEYDLEEGLGSGDSDEASI